VKPFRKNLAIAIDGGGIRGVIVTRALAILEKHLGQPLHQRAGLLAGTSTGAIVSAGLGVGRPAEELLALYLELGRVVFRKSWRTLFWPLTRYRYPQAPLAEALREHIGDFLMKDFWQLRPRLDVVITAFDLVANRCRFIKPYKPEYRDWPVAKAVLASSSVPTYFPVVDGRYVDGGVGSYANPCYIAAYELFFQLRWKPEETTLISLGTGREPNRIRPGDADRFSTLKWLMPMLGAFLHSADDQQVHLVRTFFQKLDFRRFQVDLNEPIEMDDFAAIPRLVEYGGRLGKMILDDVLDPAQEIKAAPVPAGKPQPS
jgi:hypothetical protein